MGKKNKRKSKDDPKKVLAVAAKPLSRKEKRKAERKSKKQGKNNFYLKKFAKEVAHDEKDDDVSQKSGENGEKRAVKKDPLVKLKEAAGERRKAMLIEANRDEDENLKRLEKQLKLTKKRGNKSKSFAEDGLDFILDACDPEKMRFDTSSMDDVDDKDDSDQSEMDEFPEEESTGDGAEDEESDYDMDEVCNEEEDDGDDDEAEDSEEQDNDGSDGDEDELEGEEVQEPSDDVGKEEEDDEVDGSSDEEKEQELKEDIYGRLRDEQGRVVAGSKSRYVPPALRAARLKNASTSTNVARLEKRIKGQLNRLAESNMASIARVVEDLYARNSRNDMTECVDQILRSSLVSANSLVPERLAMEHAVLVSVLHANVGVEVGANLTQRWVEAYVTELERTDRNDESAGKTLDNYLQFVAFLYAFRVVGHCLVLDIVAELAQSFRAKDVELIILVLRLVGFNLRKDSPASLKTLILDVQRKSAAWQAGSSSRVMFMLDTLAAIRNNNVKKMPNYDADHQIHLVKTSRNFLRPGASITTLNVRLADLRQADTRGRWWIVGSAWTGREPTESDDKEADGDDVDVKSKYSDELLALAGKMRMNTDARRAIFCAMMSGSDFMAAFENLVKLTGVKSPVRERECAFVLTACCLREKRFNPFYAHLAAKLARMDRKYRMAVQCAIWDRMGNLVEETDTKNATIDNLAAFTSALIRDEILGLACLKKLEFADMNKRLTRFLKAVIADLLAVEGEKDRYGPFSAVAANPKLSTLRDSLRLFMHHFMSKRTDDVGLAGKLEQAERVLMGREIKV